MSLTTDLQCIAEDDTSHYPAAAKVACASAAAEIEALQMEKEFNASQYRAEIERLTAENADLQHDINRHLDICTSLTAENERLAAGRDAAIRTLADSRFPPVTRINDAIAILSRSGIVQQTAVNSEEGK